MLPNLPKVLNKREALWSTTVFRKWALEHFNYTAIFEIKYARKDSLPFSELKQRQIAKMLTIRHDKFLWKNPDHGEETPPDFFLLVKEPTFVVIKYPKGFVGIAIDRFILESEQSKRRSLLWSRAVEIATFVEK